MTKTEVAEIGRMLVSAWPRGQWTRDSIETYCEDLEEFDAAVTRDAIKGLRRALIYPPTISECRNAIAEILISRIKRGGQ